MIAKLVCADASDMTAAISLSGLPVTIGRGSQADVQIPDQWASRLHCRIVDLHDQIVVQDLGSTYGTLVNGQPISETALNHGDTLTIGISSFRVQLDGCEQPSVLEQIGVSMKKLSSRLRTPHSNPSVGESVSRSLAMTPSEGLHDWTDASLQAADSALTEANSTSHRAAPSSVSLR